MFPCAQGSQPSYSQQTVQGDKGGNLTSALFSIFMNEKLFLWFIALSLCILETKILSRREFSAVSRPGEKENFLLFLNLKSFQ